MELIIINDRKLKVMLTQDDMEHYTVDTGNWNCDTQESLRPLRHIMEYAKETAGFVCDGERLFVQAYPDKGGGCELYITKLKKNTKGEEAGKEDLTTVCNVYHFERLDAMLQACHHLYSLGYDADSRAYAEEGGDGCYLLIQDASVDECGKIQYAYPVVADYGVKKTAVGILSYLNEHCSVLCPHQAVEMLAPFCSKSTVKTSK